MTTLCYKAARKQEFDTVKLSAIQYTESRHALFLTIMVGSVATDATVYATVGSDFLINIYKGLKIVYLLKYSSKENAANEGKFQVEKYSISDYSTNPHLNYTGKQAKNSLQRKKNWQRKFFAKKAKKNIANLIHNFAFISKKNCQYYEMKKNLNLFSN